mmetsp:Transcript_12951/g.19410  ORF Transcript_12951/g.19410 Transcript_12951/m.19410 type:complete len:373 (+) Transcript_12951:35-1153(+)
MSSTSLGSSPSPPFILLASRFARLSLSRLLHLCIISERSASIGAAFLLRPGVAPRERAGVLLVLLVEEDDFFGVSADLLSDGAGSARRSSPRIFCRTGSRVSFSAFLKLESFELTCLNPTTSTIDFMTVSARFRTSPVLSSIHFSVGVTSSFISPFFSFSSFSRGIRALKRSFLAFVTSRPLGKYGTSLLRPAAWMYLTRVRTASSRMTCFLSAKHIKIASATAPTYFAEGAPIDSTRRAIKRRARVTRFLFLSANRCLRALNTPPSLPLIRQLAPLTICSISSIACFLFCHFLSPRFERILSLICELISTRGTISSIFTSDATACPLTDLVASTFPSSLSGILSNFFVRSEATADLRPSSILSRRTLPVCL